MKNEIEDADGSRILQEFQMEKKMSLSMAKIISMTSLICLQAAEFSG